MKAAIGTFVALALLVPASAALGEEQEQQQEQQQEQEELQRQQEQQRLEQEEEQQRLEQEEQQRQQEQELYVEPRQYGLPVAPRPAELPSVRGGLEIGIGARFGGAPVLGSTLVDLGLGVDHLVGERLALGGRLGWISAVGRGPDDASFNGFEMDARARFALVRWKDSDVRQLELQVSTGLRLTSLGPHHATVGFGASASLRAMRFGVRYARALSGDAAAPHTLLGVAEWMTPAVWHYGDPRRTASTRPSVGLGLHLIAGGFGARGLGAALPGFALELPVYFGGPPLVAVARWDLLWFPLGDGHGVFCETALAGLQWFELRGSPLGVSALVGHATTHGDTPRPAAQGLVADVGLVWGLEQGFQLELHARAGLEERGSDLRAVFVSIGGRQIFR